VGSPATTAGGTPATTTGSGGFTTGNHTYAANCTNNLQPGTSQLNFTVTGTAPARVNPGAPVTVTNQSWSVTVPGALLTTGVNLGLLNDGQTVQGTVTPAESATDTAQATQAAAPISTAIGPIHVDATTGNVADVTTSFTVPNMTWTATGGTVAVAMATTKFNVSLGSVSVAFTCDPGSTDPFVSTAVSGSSTTVANPVTAPTVLGATYSPTAGASTTSSSSSRPLGPASTVAAALPLTGAPRLMVWLFVLSLILVDLGYLTWSAARPARRRTDTT
jgi:hypothetical protein